MKYWLGATASILRNVAADITGSDRRRRFDFTRHFLSSGISYDHRTMAPVRHLLQLYPQVEQLRVPLGDVEYKLSNMNPYELYCVIAIAMLSRAKRIFEIGTYDGATTLQLARVCPQAEIFTLDLAPADVAQPTPDFVDSENQNVAAGGVGRRFMGTPESSRIRQLLGDSTKFDYQPYAGSMDLVFVDACHQYEFVRSDSANALRLVRPGGVVLWHDYELGWPGVVKAVDALRSAHPIVHVAGTALALLPSSITP
jgi:predicted O-methyltransferase YrrM